MIKTILGLKEIYADYDAFIIDQWGVMHDGNKGFKTAIDCLDFLYKKDKILSIISNSSKKKDITTLKLNKLGFNQSYFKEVMTSGEMVWKALVEKTNEKVINLGKNIFYIHDETNEDQNIFLEGLENYNVVDNINKADFILGCTPFANKKIIDFIPILHEAKNNNLPFLCANPDFDTVDFKSKKLIYCMGSVAELYKLMGGEVIILGKPSTEIYNQTLNKFSDIDKSRILAIGDSLYHDIRGAISFGIDSLLITSTGIHHNFFDINNPVWLSSKNELIKIGIEPTFICSDLKL